MSDKNNYAIILCGGVGTRLWPLSRTIRPKQLLALNGDKTLLQQTANRLTKLVTEDHLYTVTHEDNKFEVIGQLEENQSTYIPKTHRHRLSNETDQTLVMIEVQCGDYVGEDDIVRFDDHYGRTSND